MKNNRNIVGCCNNTHQGAAHTGTPFTGKQTSACASNLGDGSHITCDLIDWLIDWFDVIDWLVDWLINLIDWLIGWLIDWQIWCDWLVGWSIDQFDWLIDWQIWCDWLVGWLIDWSIDWLIDWQIWCDWLVGWLIDQFGWLVDWCCYQMMPRSRWTTMPVMMMMMMMMASVSFPSPTASTWTCLQAGQPRRRWLLRSQRRRQSQVCDVIITSHQPVRLPADELTYLTSSTPPPCVGSRNCRVSTIHFLAGWHKKLPEPGFSLIRFSFSIHVKILCMTAV